MAQIKTSRLLSSILKYTDGLCEENKCSSQTADYIIAAALSVTEADDSDLYDIDELTRTKALLLQFDYTPEKKEELILKWAGKNIPFNDKIALAAKKKSAEEQAKKENRAEITAVDLLALILSGSKRSQENAEEEKTSKEAEHSTTETVTEEIQPAGVENREEESEPVTMVRIIERATGIQRELQASVFGQQHAVNAVAAGIFQAELRSAVESDRKLPRATFLLAGPPGVGKTYLAEETARVLGLPFYRFDMSEYTDATSQMELAGTPENYAGSKEGLLTGFVRKNPRCVILFDEIEKTTLKVIHLFLQVLDAGRLRDLMTNKEVDFSNAILFFTTNAGRRLYEDKQTEDLSSLSREVILDALRNEVNPQTGEPFFPGAICSRFASGSVVVLNHLKAHHLYQLAQRQLSGHADDIEKALGIDVDISPEIVSAIVFAEGASADARTVKGRADSFISSELYELYQLLSEEGLNGAEGVRRIRFNVDLEDAPENVASLFRPSGEMHVLAYTSRMMKISENHTFNPEIHYVSCYPEAEDILENYDIDYMLFDVFAGTDSIETDLLNWEDVQTSERGFLIMFMTEHPAVPVIILESDSNRLSEVEKVSYLRRGVRGFINADSEDLPEEIEELSKEVFQQNCMSRLARSNVLLSYETSQRVDQAGEEAVVELFDLKLEKAIKGEDVDNIMSLLSTPDETFDDVIGADEAKSELRYFVEYMKAPKEFRRKGVSAPKGILLYGPPGTGKTMLARAFAAEAGATFIATEGNQFAKKYVGEGSEMVHRLFAIARRYAPSILFVDEIDTIARKRTGNNSDVSRESENILTAFFAEMDGFSTDTDKPVFVLGATNYQVDGNSSMSLDPAMLRRFDRSILVDLPDKENRKRYLTNRISETPLFDVSEAEVENIADRTTGMSIALLSSMLDMAIRTAMREGYEKIDDAILDDVLESFKNGEKLEWSPETTLRTARHEAGHTVVSWILGEKPSFVTISSRADYGGYMQFADSEKHIGYTKKQLLNRVRAALGGRAAELVYYGSDEGMSTGASGDLASATDIITNMLTVYGMFEDFGIAAISEDRKREEVIKKTNEILSVQMQEAITIIKDNKNAIDQMVDQLLSSNSMNSDAIDKLFNDLNIKK